MQARGSEETANEAAPLRRRCLRRSWLLTQDEETSGVRAFPALAWDRGQRDVINARAASTNALRALSRSRDVTRREVVRANEVRGRVYGRDMPACFISQTSLRHFFGRWRAAPHSILPVDLFAAASRTPRGRVERPTSPFTSAHRQGT